MPNNSSTTSPNQANHDLQRAERQLKLAWSGWQLRMPCEWRPLKIEGAAQHGRLMVGDGDETLFQIKWSRAAAKRFDPQRWLAHRLRTVGGRKLKIEEAFSLKDFFPSAWLERPARGRGRRAAMWCGYAPAARLLLECVLNPLALDRSQDQIRHHVLPSLKLAQSQAGSQWAVFDASFHIPPDLNLIDKRLMLGDIMLRFAGRGRRRLAVRQVYPASLALQRRSMEQWLRAWPYSEFRRVKGDDSAQTWHLDRNNCRLAGFKRAGHKCIPRPLGWIGAQETLSVGVHDEQKGRLLLAEYDTSAQADETLLSQVVAKMDRATLETEPAP